jgi:hypothetical protein
MLFGSDRTLDKAMKNNSSMSTIAGHLVIATGSCRVSEDPAGRVVGAGWMVVVTSNKRGRARRLPETPGLLRDPRDHLPVDERPCSQLPYRCGNQRSL